MNKQSVTHVEFFIRQVFENNEPGKVLAGPFETEKQALEKLGSFPSAKVFMETWLS